MFMDGLRKAHLLAHFSTEFAFYLTDKSLSFFKYFNFKSLFFISQLIILMNFDQAYSTIYTTDNFFDSQS